MQKYYFNKKQEFFFTKCKMQMSDALLLMFLWSSSLQGMMFRSINPYLARNANITEENQLKEDGYWACHGQRSTYMLPRNGTKTR